MNFIQVPEELSFGVEKLTNYLNLNGEAEVVFEKGEGMSLSERNGQVVIGYNEPRDAYRAMTFLKTFLKDKRPISQKAKFERLTLMADCSRNAVINMDSAKEMMTALAAMGFNALMFYTEDTYEIPEYPYFGHMRGRYTVAEMKELNDFGKKMGLEIIPCIQTLAHLNALTNWEVFKPYIDVADILLADDERSYKLIEAMFKTLRECFDSKFLHIGMDEAHLLGRGKHTDKFGYEEKSDIMLRHLDKVVSLCKKYDFTPIMWSDMFFRMQFGGSYNVAEGELSKEVTDRIPPEVALCYWNYYTNPNQPAMLEHMFHCHAETGNDIWFAGGSWGWYGPTPKNRFSNWVTPTQLSFAEKYGIGNIIATAWGDDGAECAIFDIFPSLLQYAELCYDKADDATLDKRSRECFGLSYEDFLKLDQVGWMGGFGEGANHPPVLEKIALYNDVMLGIMDWDLDKADLDGKYAKDAELLASVPENRFSYLFETQLALAKLLDKKCGLSAKIKSAYRADDKEALKAIAETDIPETVTLLSDFINTFRRQWYTVNKPFGFEIQDLRLGGVKERLTSSAERLLDYVNGNVERLEELEQPDLPFSGNPDRPTFSKHSWRLASTASVISHT